MDVLLVGLGLLMPPSKESLRLLYTGKSSVEACSRGRSGATSVCTCLRRLLERLTADPMSGIAPGRTNSPSPLLEPN